MAPLSLHQHMMSAAFLLGEFHKIFCIPKSTAKRTPLKNISLPFSSFYPSITCSILLVAGVPGSPSLSLGFEKVEYVREFRAGLQEPVDVDLAMNGDVYVLDKEASKVFIYDASGKPKLDFGRPGSGPGQLDEPESIAVSPKGQVFVADTENDRIQAFDASGKFLFQFGSSGDRPGQLNEPSGL